MTTNFSMRPIGVFFRFLGRMIFPRLIHLAFIADDVKEVSVTTALIALMAPSILLPFPPAVESQVTLFLS